MADFRDFREAAADATEHRAWTGYPDGDSSVNRIEQVPFPPVLNEVACLEKGLSALSEAIELLEQALKEVLRQDDEKDGADDPMPPAASPLVYTLSLANQALARQMGRLHKLRHRLTV